MESLKENRYLKLKPGQLQIGRKYFDMDVDVILQSIEILEDWAKKQNHFVVKEFDRCFLERLILICKGSLEKVKMRIDKQLTLRTLLPQYFVSQIPKEDEHLYEKIKVIPLPELNDNLERIIIAKIGNVNMTPSNYAFYIRNQILVVEFLYVNDFSTGNILLYDLRDLNFIELMTNISLSEMRHLETIFLGAYSARISHIFILTHYKAVDVIFTFLKRFLSPKIASRVHIGSNHEILYDFVDKKLLPADYGGSKASLDILHEDLLKELKNEEFINHMKKICELKTDESRRLTDRFNDLYMGVAGTFRTITVD